MRISFMNDLEMSEIEIIQDPDISTDLETNGFDLSAGKIWIYPENYPVREYQYNIVEKALFYNTLVCLPTGLGKTFVAAVVMYNFWRWYPRGKIVFLAPTRPLVAQQIDACYNVMGIPSIESIELTGNINQKAREKAWFKNRVFFATPQVFHNDLENNIIPSELVKCVVIDEAHKALGKHSYCECIRILKEKNRYFRVLALSATPGNKIANVHQVVQNLCISHIELRDETSLDITPYINQRKTDIILVPLGEELEKFKDRYINIMDRHVKFLIRCNVIRGQTANISKGKIFMILREFQKTPNQSGNNEIKKALNILLTMYHAYELMIRHGLRAFYKFYQNHSDKFWMNSETQLQELLAEVQTYLGPFPDPQLFISGNTPEIPDNLVFGHNKFLKLKELLLHHFTIASSSGKDTRAIVFVEYRDIVSEVYVLLLQTKPLIRPQMFVGRSEQKQKNQIKAIEDFRQNRVNVLISTSIGEEGLDVGEVDLIICFDVSQKNPTRLVQRMGRTGRKRDGHIIVLVTDGKENEALKSTMARRESLNSKILNTSNINSSLYEENPRMIPDVCNPECRKMHIHIKPKTPVKKGTKSKKVDNQKSNETSTKKTKTTKQSSINEIRNTNQPSLSKFLVNKKLDVHSNNDNDYNNDDDDFVEIIKPTIVETTTLNNKTTALNNKTTALNNKTNLIKASNVKLLTCDNEAVDFLTLCAMKKSEEEMRLRKPKVDTTYMCLTESITNFIDFTIPSLDILDDLADYLSNIKIDLSLPKEPSQNDYDDDDNFCFSNRYNILSPVNVGINVSTNITKSKFEDLLNESTDSDDIADDENNLNNLDTDVNIIEHNTAGTVTNSKCSKQSDNFNPPNTNSYVPMEAEVSFFEDIFNDSFDSIESDCNDDNVENIQLKISDSNNDSSKITTSNKIQEKTNNSTLTNMLVKEQPTEERSKHCESMYSITQAVNKIAQINSKENVQTVLTEVKDTLQDVAQKSEYTLTSNKLLIQSDYESEDDIFASDSEDLKMNAPDNESKNITNSKNETLPNSEQSINTKLKCIGENQFEYDDFEWNNDFEVSSVSAANSKYFNLNSTTNDSVKNNGTLESSFANDIMGDDTDSDEWISFQQKSKPEECAKNNSMKIAKKLSTIRHSIPNSISVDDQNDSENDFVISTNDIDKLNQLETSYFSKQKSQNNDTSIPSSSNCRDNTSKKVETRKMKLNKLSSFKAPDKYVKSQDFNKTSQSSQSQYMKSSRNSSYTKKSTSQKSKVRSQCEYIDYEAAVSLNSSESSNESSGVDEDLKDFVSYTQYAQEEDVHALYLQASKSPVKRPGAFIFKEPQESTEIEDIYSQPCSQADETYLQDSFCVSGDEDNDVDKSKLVHGYSILEEAEKILETKKRKRMKSDESENSVWKNRKKRKKNKVINISSDNSSEDETEKLRIDIQNESMMLKGLHP
ncbi:PREDICTED: Fanconi anemia group M protein isoform X2 [Polistes dominula]|uniref:Fanconi anemia group M protein isoform X2 n=1 Tax=Polistes dominula TaxID=743375 RepID=A0ABM1JEF8_POLDO|nr:PREDICTED: Fanconi anemia group M protein isoform X2 [Polistes dominula]